MKGLLKLTLVVAVLALAAYIILPTIPGHKHPPYIRDMNNLKMIYMGCMLYAMNHGGEFPPNLEALTETEIDNPAAFVRWQNRQSAGALTNVSAWTDYVYVPGSTEDSPHDAVVAYLPPGVYTWKDETGAAVVCTWVLLSAYTFALVMIGDYWVPCNPELHNVFPEGPHFIAACMGGWIYGMMTSGLGLLGRRLVDKHKEKLQNNRIEGTN